MAGEKAIYKAGKAIKDGVDSLLRIGLEENPQNKQTGEQVIKTLEKRGVKEDELKFSGFDKLDPKKKYTKDELLQMEENRPDYFGVIELDVPGWKSVSLPKGAESPTYKERIYTFSEDGGKPADALISEDAQRFFQNNYDYEIGSEDSIKSYQEMFEKYPGSAYLFNETGIDHLSATELETTLRSLANNRISVEDRRALDRVMGTDSTPEDEDTLARLMLTYGDNLENTLMRDASTTPKSKSRYNSSHFGDTPNYLFHTRSFQDTVNGRPTHVVQEIQSDLHQQGRQYGYRKPIEKKPAVLASNNSNEVIERLYNIAMTASTDNNPHVLFENMPEFEAEFRRLGINADPHHLVDQFHPGDTLESFTRLANAPILATDDSAKLGELISILRHDEDNAADASDEIVDLLDKYYEVPVEFNPADYDDTYELLTAAAEQLTPRVARHGQNLPPEQIADIRTAYDEAIRNFDNLSRLSPDDAEFDEAEADLAAAVGRLRTTANLDQGTDVLDMLSGDSFEEFLADLPAMQPTSPFSAEVRVDLASAIDGMVAAEQEGNALRQQNNRDFLIDTIESLGIDTDGVPWFDLRTIEDLEQYLPTQNNILDQLVDETNPTAYTSGPPVSPYETHWMARGIERELQYAFENGMNQLAIPIKGPGVGKLQRGKGVQQMYENKVVNEMKKIAKKHKLQFELTPSTGTRELAQWEKQDLDSIANNILRFDEYIKQFDTPEDWPESAWDRLEAFNKQFGDLYDEDDPLYALGVATEGKEAIINKLAQAKSGLTDKLQYAIIKAEQAPDLQRVKGEDRVILESYLEGGNNTATAEQLLADKYGYDPDFDEPLSYAKNMLGKSKPGEINTSKFKPKLYSAPAAGIMAAYMGAKEAGLSPEEFLKAEGYEGQELIDMRKEITFIDNAINEGHDPTEVGKFLQTKEVQVNEPTEVEDPGLWDRIKQGIEENKQWYAEQQLINGVDSSEELFRHMRTVYPNMSSVTSRLRAYGGNKELQERNRQLQIATARNIRKIGQEYGMDIRYVSAPEGGDPGLIDMLDGGGRYFIVVPEGQEDLRDPEDGAPIKQLELGMMQELAKEKNEIIFGTLGAIGAGVKGAEQTAKFTKNPWAIGAGAIVSSMLGAVGGTVGGTEVDYLMSSIELGQELDAQTAAMKGLTAAESSVIADAVGGTFGYGLTKFGQQGWKAFRGVLDAVKDKNLLAAKDMLQKYLFMSDDEAEAFVKQVRQITDDKDVKAKTYTVRDWVGHPVKTVTNTTSTMNKNEEILRDLVLTQPGGEGVLKAAAAVNPQAGRSVAKAIDTRAKDLLARSKTENVGKTLIDDLANYQTSVKQFYGDVKNELSAYPNLQHVKFNYDKLAVEPLVTRLANEVTDPAVETRFLRQAALIKEASTGRTMADLVELRQLVNDFRFNRRITKKADQEALADVVEKMDASLQQGVRQLMGPEADRWLADWAKAKSQYAEMSSLKKNVLARVIQRPGISEDTIVKTLVKHINDIDGTFNDVMEVLPKQARVKAEWGVMDNLANKWTGGEAGSWNATHFPALADDLNKITFTDPEARKMKAAVNRLAQVFKNDIRLADSSGYIQLPKFQSYLTTDPAVRAQFEIASSVFNKVKERLPTDEGKKIALVTKTAELLENPLNSKTVKEIMDLSGNDVAITNAVARYQQQAARESARTTDSAIGKFFEDKDGLLSTKGKGKSQSIPLHRIASYDVRKQVADKYGIDPNNTKAIDKALKSEGYLAVQQGSDKVRKLK